MITPKTQVSGTSNQVVKAQPRVIEDKRPHPAFPMCMDRATAEPFLKDLLCYHIEDFGIDGISVLVDKKASNYMVTFADWFGTKIEMTDSKSRLKDIAADFLGKRFNRLLQVMKMIRLDTAMYYFALDQDSDFVLTDVMLNPNKLCGPGMVRDVFGTTFRTQTVKLIDKYTPEYADRNRGIIIKPSRFRTVMLGDAEVPLYARI
jgi:hypothetical protein